MIMKLWEHPTQGHQLRGETAPEVYGAVSFKVDGKVATLEEYLRVATWEPERTETVAEVVGKFKLVEQPS